MQGLPARGSVQGSSPSLPIIVLEVERVDGPALGCLQAEQGVRRCHTGPGVVCARVLSLSKSNDTSNGLHCCARHPGSLGCQGAKPLCGYC